MSLRNQPAHGGLRQLSAHHPHCRTGSQAGLSPFTLTVSLNSFPTVTYLVPGHCDTCVTLLLVV